MIDPWKGTALRNAQEHPGEEWPPNDGHRFCVRTLDTTYYADAVSYDPLTGYPIWSVSHPGYCLKCQRLENAVIYEYEI
jgi:hypothetical protein